MKKKPPVTCWSCDGFGKTKEGYGYGNDYAWESCERCGGAGTITADVAKVMNQLATLSQKHAEVAGKIRKRFDVRINKLEAQKSNTLNRLREKQHLKVSAIKTKHAGMHLPFWNR